MATYPYLTPGAILRARPQCDFPDHAAYIAVSPTGETYLLDADEYELLLRCDGLTPLNEISGLDPKLLEDVSFSDLVSIATSPTPCSSGQTRSTSNLVSPCRQAIWHLTRLCNMSCRHCYYLYDDPGAVKSTFSYDEIRSIAAHLGDLGVESVRLSGGEAAIDVKRFEAAISALTDNCLPIIVNTNGWKHEDNIIAAATGNPYFRAVQVSLDGPRFAHNDMRVNGSFDAIKSNVRKFVNRGLHVRVISMLTERWMQRDAIWEMCTHMADAGVTDWVIEIPSVTGLCTIGSTGETSKIFDAALAFYSFLESQPHQISSFCLTQIFDWPHNGPPIQRTLDDPICLHDLGLLSFGPEGISYCTLFREQFGPEWKDIGKMEADQYKELWNRIARQRTSRKIRDNPACASCQLFHICQGGCPGQYNDAINFQGCDFHSRNLALVKQRLCNQLGWEL